MKFPDIIAIAIGVVGLLFLTQTVALPAFITDLSSNAFVAECLTAIAKHPTVAMVCCYVACGAFLLSGVLRIWLDSEYTHWIWAAGAVAIAVICMILFNDRVFSWAWESDLYSAGTTEIVLTIFHFCWLFGCPFAALLGAFLFSDESIFCLPDIVCKTAMPFWVIPICGIGGFIASLIPFGVLLLVLIPLNYVFTVVDTIFIVLALILIALFIKFGLL